MRQYADILAFDKYGQLSLIVEVKNKRGAFQRLGSKNETKYVCTWITSKCTILSFSFAG